jgi:hypothetical protein
VKLLITAARKENMLAITAVNPTIDTSRLKVPKSRKFVYHGKRRPWVDGKDLLTQRFERSRSGYMQRRLINALEYLRVEHDGTVRDAQGNIIEFRYGEDGVDPAKSDHGKAVNVERLVDRIKIMSISVTGHSKSIILTLFDVYTYIQNRIVI